MYEYSFTEGVDLNPDKNVRVRTDGRHTVSDEVTGQTIFLSMYMGPRIVMPCLTFRYESYINRDY